MCWTEFVVSVKIEWKYAQGGDSSNADVPADD
jgi:hypothetical protein